MELEERYDEEMAAVLESDELAAYVGSARGGAVKVAYTRTGLGRFASRRVADGGAYSYATMPKVLRARLASSAYEDIDMENSHPRLAVQQMAALGVEHAHMAEYVENREARLSEVAAATGVDRTAAKQLFLALCFGGSTRAWATEHGVDMAELPAYVEGLQRELRQSMAGVVSCHPDAERARRQQEARNPGAGDPLATRFAYIMQDAERRCLEAIVEAVQMAGRQVGALIHDGLLVSRAVSGSRGDDTCLLLRACEANVLRQTGFRVRLAVKPWPGYGTSPLALMLRPSNSPVVEFPPLTTHSLADADAESVRDALGVTHHCKEWSCEELSAGGLKLTAIGCCQCLVDPSKRHRSWSNSCAIMTGRGTAVTLCCHVDGKRQLRGQDLKNALVAFKALAGLSEEGPKQSSYERLLAKVEEYASARALRKVGGGVRTVFRPIEGCPCAYEPHLKFTEFIQSVLKGDPDYKSNVRRASELETYMDKYNEDAFPNLVRDRDILSFSNGVLVLSEARFVPYPVAFGAGDEQWSELAGRVARHHIPLPYTGETHTPLFDKVLMLQYPDEGDGRPEALCALIGRLLFKVKQMDNWQVMPLVMGEGGTGKSTVLAVAAAMFEAHAVSEVDCSNEKTFGLQDKYDKELLLIRDAPVSMSAVLPQEQFQKMVTGEGVQVSVKNGMAFAKGWKVPMLAAANTMFDYKDNMGQVSRRVVVFRFSTVVQADTADASLEEHILGSELPNVVARCLGAYRALLGDGGARKSYWAICPPTLREAQEEAQAEGNLVQKFLRAGPDESATRRMRTYVVQRRGAVTVWSEFKKAFDAYVRYKHPGERWVLKTDERGPFARLGYCVVHENMCKACGKPGLSGCCDEYRAANRIKRWRILDMELVREEVEVTWGVGGDDELEVGR